MTRIEASCWQALPCVRMTDAPAGGEPWPNRCPRVSSRSSALVSVTAVAAGLYLGGVRDEAVYLGALALVALYAWVFLSHLV